jgi:hypothetical protein
MIMLVGICASHADVGWLLKEQEIPTGSPFANPIM